MSGARHWEQDKEATVYVGNLDERVTDQLVWELMLQAGRIVNVHLPKDRVTQTHQGYGFVEFISEEDAEYAAKIMNQVRLYGKPIRVNKASADKQKTVEVGAELFIGNLDPMVDEKTLYDTFSRFGSLISAPKVARDDANLSKGYGFVSFSNFEASDDAIANMNGQFLMNKEISVQYAYKKDGKGERHGDEAERTLAAQARKHNVEPMHQPIPQQMFAPPAPAAMLNGDGRGAHGAPSAPNGFHFGHPPSNYHNVPPQQHHQPPHRPPSAPLPPPPSGLPARPPPSQAGYGGPAGFVPQGFNSPAPPPGFAAPPGFGPPPGHGAPPGLPPGFQRR
ncbi:RNA-binding domain-containing protein [Lepidopterella palustris CBS 459.81]|uniref:RNA-binding domain-containing protein n=1 Tax=Lepidopterella palustris CBS 459.81 TaxID=1314670 RepID=A0A8E2EJQ9_9PEZI|nr:RNA-binding domain-containing protein [Lepidopterella palustris CBS 459.81]